jgi:tetratricopeptide (TPR) repeat protein
MTTYDAFISYSHAKDKPVAAVLQSVIQTLGKPWYQRRALRVFRDDTSLSATPHLWPSIEQALNQSRYLILLASPEAAASPWVAKEIAHWLAHRSVDTLLIGITDGDLAWDERASDFAWNAATPLPAMLKGRFATEPKWVDLRAFRADAQRRDERLRDLAADFAAAVRGMPKEDLLSQEVRQQRRALALAWSAATLLLGLVIFASWQWREAERSTVNAQRAEGEALRQQALAERQRDQAEKTLTAATRNANDLILNLAVKLRNRPGMSIDLARDILDRAQALHRRLKETGADSIELRHSEALGQLELARTYSAQGDIDAALTSAERSRVIFEPLAEQNPNDEALHANLSSTYNLLGHIYVELDEPEKGLSAHRRDLGIAERFAKLHPDDDDWQRNLVISFLKIGAVLNALNRRDEALASYRQALAVADKRVTDHPDGVSQNKDLAATYRHIGDALAAAERWEPALNAHRRLLQISKSNAEKFPKDTELQHDLLIAYGTVGRTLLLMGEQGDSADALRKAVEIADALVVTDPGNVDWQTDLIAVLEHLSTVADHPRPYLVRALEIIRRLDREGKLTMRQQAWILPMEEALAGMPE